MDFAKIYSDAYQAGLDALSVAKPTPIVVGTPVSIFAPNSPLDRSKPVYYEPEGVCGFAWVSFKGTTPFGRWAKKAGVASKGYPSGLQVWVSEGGQSVERKEAFARAFAKVLQSNGIDAYADSRLD